MNRIAYKCLAFAESDDPFPPELVGVVLPHGLDAVLEQVEVGVGRELTRPDLQEESSQFYELVLKGTMSSTGLIGDC